MIRRVQLVTVCVSDQDRAIAFFCDKLGFELLHDTHYGDNKRWVEVAPVNGETALTLSLPSERHGGEVGACQPVVFACEDIDGEYEELLSRGVEFTGPITHDEGGASPVAFFKDDDDNRYLLVESPLTAREEMLQIRHSHVHPMPSTAES